MTKSVFAFLTILVMFGSTIEANALVGMPDDTLGCDAVVPFICDISREKGLNTLIVFEDAGFKNGIDFHYTVFNVKSVTISNNSISGTKGDIVSTDAFTEVDGISINGRKALEVDMDNDLVNDHYAGYIYYDNRSNYNSVVGQIFFVNLPDGISASSNIPMKEYKDSIPKALQSQMAPNNIESFSPNALAGALNLQDGNTNVVNAKTFGLYQRFYIADENALTWFIFWTSKNGVINNVHVDIYDNEENVISSNIAISSELTILDVNDSLSSSTFSTYPKEGWINLYWDNTNITDIQDLEILGWTYLQAFGSVGQSWTVLTPMWRDASY